MNKTVSINLGGFFFHIDEDAYQKLNRYFDAIRRSLSPDGKDEIMSDIEGRIAELLSEKLKNDKQVAGIREIDEVIAVMGQPEDYRIDEEVTGAKNTYTGAGYPFIRTRKFYRDGDKSIISGVCAGLAHYFRIDPLWIRILFVISLFISFGTSIFIYILLWILIPKAITTTEKLEMTGEPINISNIERKVKEEIDMVAEKFRNVDYDKLGANAKNGAEKVGSGIGYVFSVIFKVIAKIIGAFITIISAVGLGSLVIMLILLLFSTSMSHTAWYPYIGSLNYTDAPVWVVGFVGFFAIAVPLFALFLLGLKILVDNLKPIGNITKYTLLALWILSLGSIIYLGMRQASEISAQGKSLHKKEIVISESDTLNIKFRYNDYFTKSLRYNSDFWFVQDSAGNDVIYSNDVTFYVLKTDEALPYVQIEKLASGSTSSEARKRAEKIKYNFEIQGNTLILDNYLLTDSEQKFRQQKIEIYLYLPKGTFFKPDMSVQLYDNTDNSFFDLWFDSADYIYQMEANSVNCLNCGNGESREGNSEMPPPAPEEPPHHATISASAKGVHIANENVDMHISPVDVSITTKKTN